MPEYVDLHLHSCYSDGVFTPEQLVIYAAQKRLKTISICDHDSVNGIDEAIFAGEIYGVEIIPAVELSVQYKEYSDVHLIGYFINHHDAYFQEKLIFSQLQRESRGLAIVERLNSVLAAENKPLLAYSDICKDVKGVLGRPHIARGLVAIGVAANIQDAFKYYLEPYNIPKKYLPIEEALSEIKRIGGLAVLAHPTSISREFPLLKKIILELNNLGLDGLEVHNNMCYKHELQMLRDIAVRFNLLITGGSDFHGFESDVEMGTIRGGNAISSSSVSAMKNRLKTIINSFDSYK